VRNVITTAEAILSQIQRWVHAEIGGDADALDRLAAQDFALVGPVGFVLGREQWIDRYRRPDGLNMQSLEWTDTVVREFGDVVVVIGVQTQKAAYAGRRSDGRFRVTQVWVREVGMWKLASLHYSTISGRPPFEDAPHAQPSGVEGGPR
jgi:ketosteroid isomerase-like protein